MAVFLLKAQARLRPTCRRLRPARSSATSRRRPRSPTGSRSSPAEGITGGCGGGNYCPDNPVTRAQMAVFLLKAEHGSAYVAARLRRESSATWPARASSPTGSSSSPPKGSPAAAAAATTARPHLTRGQMAVFLVKTFGLQLYGPAVTTPTGPTNPYFRQRHEDSREPALPLPVRAEHDPHSRGGHDHLATVRHTFDDWPRVELGRGASHLRAHASRRRGASLTSARHSTSATLTIQAWSSSTRRPARRR